jgi:hypothetical protein
MYLESSYVHISSRFQNRYVTGGRTDRGKDKAKLIGLLTQA